MIRAKRIYDPAGPTDGYRVLVDRLWPRGLRKEDAKIDEWLKGIAPSTELRRWFGHDPSRWNEFVARYERELEAPEAQAHLARLRRLAERGTVTLLYAAREDRYNNAKLLADLLGRH